MIRPVLAKITTVKTPPTKKELKESEQFYKSLPPFGKRNLRGR